MTILLADLLKDLREDHRNMSIMLDLPLVKMSGFEVEYASVTCVQHHATKTEVQLLNFAPWRDRL